MGRPAGSPNKDKPFRDALRMEALELAKPALAVHPIGSLRWNAQRLLLIGDVQSIREIADRLDGRVPQAVVGDDGEDPVSLRTIITGVARAADGEPKA